MGEKELLTKLYSDLALSSLPFHEVDFSIKPYSKTFWGKYYPVEDYNTMRARIFIYPYTKINTLLPYEEILKVVIHELIHHVQFSSANYKRVKGVMHDESFWRMYNNQIEFFEERGILSIEKHQKSIREVI